MFRKTCSTRRGQLAGIILGVASLALIGGSSVAQANPTPQPTTGSVVVATQGVKNVTEVKAAARVSSKDSRTKSLIDATPLHKAATSAVTHCGRTGYSLFLHFVTENGLDQQYFSKTLSGDRLAICLRNENKSGEKHKIGEDTRTKGHAYSKVTTSAKTIAREVVLRQNQQGWIRTRFDGQVWEDTFQGI